MTDAPPDLPAEVPGFAARMEEMRRAGVTPQRTEMRRLADAMRLVIERLVATRAPQDELARAAAALEDVAAALDGFPRGHSFEGFAESSNSGDPHAFFDHSPIIGRANPLAPPLDLAVVDGRVAGRAVFGSAYEGPPGAVHGGYVAAAFDELLGMAQSLGGKPGMTGTLTVRYRRPHPLHTEIQFEAELVRVEGRKIFTVGRSFAQGELRAEAEGIFISVDFSKIAELMARREPEG
ncbi:MAG: PaaI family thioesterase [Actinomycetota bacterium]|nr:PaaI family thioesterase [Actinomycetota bacterium]